MSKRATLEEVKDFANRVRKAGGGNPLDALMPAVPQAMEECLIAKNLNFNCAVRPLTGYRYDDAKGWVMRVNDRETRDKIAHSLQLNVAEDLGTNKYGPRFGIVLPEKYALVAIAFDKVYDYMRVIVEYDAYLKIIEKKGIEETNNDWGFFSYEPGEYYTPFKEKQELQAFIDRAERDQPGVKTVDEALVREMLPYIEESKKEAYLNATIVREDGSIVI